LISPRPSPPTNSYDVLASFYERYWGRAFLPEAIHLFQGELVPRLKARDSVLELCCGTGHFAEWLLGEEYRVTAVDFSKAMIEYAHARVPPAHALQGDARNLRLADRFDAVVCFYNSLNQFLNPADVRAVLASAHAHLKPGGWLLFDVVTERGFIGFWEADETVHLDAMECKLSYRFDGDIASCRIVFEGSEVVLRQRPYSLDFISEELAAAGFDSTTVTAISQGYPPEGRFGVVARRKHT
jgi:SAM-dependent methyltransferase